MTNEEMIKWIDGADYELLLRRNRFGKVGDSMFVGEVGKHFQEILKKRRDETPSDERVEISKRIGWKK